MCVVVVVDIIKSCCGGRMYWVVGVVLFWEVVFIARVIGSLTTFDWLNVDVIECLFLILVLFLESENVWDEWKDDYFIKVVYVMMVMKVLV